MGRLKNLMGFLPIYYKEADTYKDSQGKGILERYLEVCGEYLEDIIVPDIESTLDLIDIDNTKAYYINYLWEFLGEFPFGHTAMIDQDKWNQYYNGLDTDLEKEAKSRLWTLVKNSPIYLSDKRVRDLLKYTLTLHKIRGTQTFFTTAFGMYGLNCTITDPYKPGSYSSLENGILSNQDGWIRQSTKVDAVKFDVDTLDDTLNPEQCTEITFNITLGDTYDIDHNLVVLEDVENAQDFHMLIHDSDITDPTLAGFRLAVEGFINRYIPFNCKAKVLYDGLTIDDMLSLRVDVLNSGTRFGENLVEGIIDSFDCKVGVTSPWPYADLSYQVSANGGTTWGDPTTEPIYKIFKEGTYLFRATYDTSIIESITIGRYPVKTTYKLEITNNTESTELSPSIPAISYSVVSYKKIEVDMGNGWEDDTYLNLPFMDNLTGQVYTPTDPSDTEEQINITLNTPGIHRISMVEFRSYFEDLNITRHQAQYFIRFYKVVNNSPVEVTTQDFDGTPLTFTIRVTDTYNTQHLVAKCLSSGKIYADGDTFTLDQAGDYKFVCLSDPNAEEFTLKLEAISKVRFILLSVLSTPIHVAQGLKNRSRVPLFVNMALIRGNATDATGKVNVFYKGSTGVTTRVGEVTATPMANNSNVFELRLGIVPGENQLESSIIQEDYYEDLDELPGWQDNGVGTWIFKSLDDTNADPLEIIVVEGKSEYTGVTFISVDSQGNTRELDEDHWGHLSTSDGRTIPYWSDLRDSEYVVGGLTNWQDVYIKVQVIISGEVYEEPGPANPQVSVVVDTYEGTNIGTYRVNEVIHLEELARYDITVTPTNSIGDFDGGEIFIDKYPVDDDNI